MAAKEDTYGTDWFKSLADTWDQNEENMKNNANVFSSLDKHLKER